MTQIKRLNDIENASQFTNYVKNKELLIYEDVEGSIIYVCWDGDRFIIKPKSLRMEALNFVDLAIQKYYNIAYSYFSKLPDYVTELLCKNWWFCFEYFPDNQPANIKYDKIPKNNLILKCIVKGNKYTYNYEEIMEYSNLFKVEPLPVLYKGVLSNEQLEKIQMFLNTSEKDLEFVFNNKTFTEYFFNLLNPDLTNSFLMSNFNDNTEKIVIKIIGDDDYLLELLNPLYKKMEHNNTTEFVDTYSLILLNFLEFCQLINLSKYKLKSVTKDELYLDIICEMFNDYIGGMKDNIIKNWIIDIPPFFNEDKFKINVDFIKNKKTIDIINSDSKLEYMFKSILGSFHKRRKKPIGIFNEQTLKLFNSFIDKLDTYLSNKLNINTEMKYQKSDIKNFKDFWDLKYNTDSEGRIYPDVYDMYDKIEGGEKKKKGKETEFKGEKGFDVQSEKIK